MITKYFLLIYHQHKLLSLFTCITFYCGEGKTSHQLINEKCIIDLYHDIECLMFDYFGIFQDKTT